MQMPTRGPKAIGEFAELLSLSEGQIKIALGFVHWLQ